MRVGPEEKKLFDIQPKAIILLNIFKHGFHLDLAP